MFIAILFCGNQQTVLVLAKNKINTNNDFKQFQKCNYEHFSLHSSFCPQVEVFVLGFGLKQKLPSLVMFGFVYCRSLGPPLKLLFWRWSSKVEYFVSNTKCFAIQF